MIERWQLKELVESMRCTRRTAWTGSEGGWQGRQRRLQASAMVCGQSRQGAVTGIVLYAGEDTLPFGDGFYAVPLAALGA